MYSKFLNLDEEKKEKIINVALDKFSYSMYKNVSTDEIASASGISKGALFHYFKSKKQLYMFLYDYSVELFKREFYNKIDFKEKDIFNKLINVTYIKIELVKKHPNLFNFIFNAVYMENEPDLKKEISNKNYNFTIENYCNFLNDIDKSKFRGDINPDKAIELIMLTMEGYANKEATKLKIKSSNNIEEVYDKWVRDVNEYIEIMKKIYYKGK